MKLINLFTLTNCIQTVCIIGCSIQIKYILTNYFNFDYITITEIDVPSETMLPDVVISVDTLRFINHSKLINSFPAVLTSFKPFKDPSFNPKDKKHLERLHQQLDDPSIIAQLSAFISDNLTINQTSAILYQPRELIQSVWIRPMEEINKHPPTVDFTDKCKFRSYFKTIYFYIVIACTPPGGKPFVGSTLVNDLIPGTNDFFALLFNYDLLSSLDSVKVAFIEPNSLPNDRRIKWTTFKIDSTPSVYLLNFYEFTISLLPDPYTECVNYPAEGYSNRMEKLETCFTNLSFEKFNRPFYSCLLPASIDEPFVSFEAYRMDKRNETFKSNINSILNQCEEQTQAIDCYTHMYIVRSMSVVQSLSKLTALITDVTKFPNISVKYRPKLSAIDCLISIGGILGFWFGFAINVHFPQIFNCLWSETIIKLNQRFNSQTKCKKTQKQPAK